MNTTANTTVEKFTPGPWAVQAMHQILWIGTPKENGQLGELILHINQDESYNTEKKERNIANAKLIAAAPDLLQALKLARMTIKELAGKEVYEQTSVATTIDAAIKKATEILTNKKSPFMKTEVNDQKEFRDFMLIALAVLSVPAGVLIAVIYHSNI